MVLLSNFLLYMLCSVTNCNYHFETPGDDSPRPSTRTGRTSKNELFDHYPVVQTRSGKVKGYIMKTIRHRNIHAFEGIPYGESTEGKNRFQPPVPKRKWSGVRNAFHTGSVCLQYNPLRYVLPIQGGEDCLFLNIYTHTGAFTRGEKYPVIFWIHGGSYFYGAGSDTGPAYLLEKDVILVTINYRLGILGFLSTGDELLPGNNGLKDQALALKWVHENIENFGGDLSRITVMGESAGGASAHYLMMSPMTQPYFSGAILMSGSALHSWGFRGMKTREILNRKLARIARCPDGPSAAFFNCIKKKNPYFLTGMQMHMFPASFVKIILFGPVEEHVSSNSSNVPFITKRPEEIYDMGGVARIPVMFSKTSGEGDIPSLIVNGFGMLGDRVFKMYWKGSAAGLLELIFSDDPADKMQKIEDEYFPGRSISETEVTIFDDIITDRFHGVGTHKAIQRQSLISPTYAMLISGQLQTGVTSSILGVPQGRTLIHADDVFLIFNGTEVVKPLKTTDPDYALTEVLVAAIAHFAVHRNTNFTKPANYGEWTPVTDPCNVEYWNVTPQGAKMTPLPPRTVRNYQFWQNLGLIDTLRNPMAC